MFTETQSACWISGSQAANWTSEQLFKYQRAKLPLCSLMTTCLTTLTDFETHSHLTSFAKRGTKTRHNDWNNSVGFSTRTDALLYKLHRGRRSPQTECSVTYRHVDIKSGTVPWNDTASFLIEFMSTGSFRWSCSVILAHTLRLLYCISPCWKCVTVVELCERWANTDTHKPLRGSQTFVKWTNNCCLLISCPVNLNDVFGFSSPTRQTLREP